MTVKIREFLNEAERELIETETETDNTDAEKTFSKWKKRYIFLQFRFLNCDFKKTFQITFHRGITLFHSFLLACLLIIILSLIEDFEIESILAKEALSLTDRVALCKRIRKIFVRGMKNPGENVCLWNPEYSSRNLESC